MDKIREQLKVDLADAEEVAKYWADSMADTWDDTNWSWAETRVRALKAEIKAMKERDND